MKAYRDENGLPRVGIPRKSKLNWDNLTRDERTRYMQLQMSPQGGYDRSGYLPDDCGECGACGQPTLGTGWCRGCYLEWRELYDKLVAPSSKQGET